MALSTFVVGQLALSGYSLYQQDKAEKKAEKEAEEEKARQKEISDKAKKEQARVKEITSAETIRTEAKTKSRRTRSGGGGGLLTGGETGLMGVDKLGD